MLHKRKKKRHSLHVIAYVALAVLLTSCIKSAKPDDKNKVSIAQILDSVAIYLDSVPNIVQSVYDSIPPSFDTSQHVSFCETDFKELQNHLKASLFKRYTSIEKEANVLGLLRYKITEEINQYNHQAYLQYDLRNIFDSISNKDFWKNGERVMEAKWMDSDTLIILLGQSHSFDFSDEENRHILKIQTDIFKLNERLIDQGVDLFFLEGFTVKEIDRRIPTKTRLQDMFKSIEKYYEYHIDSSRAIYTYGLESIPIHTCADSVFKLMLFTEGYLDLDSVNLPRQNKDFMKSFKRSVEYLLDSMPVFSNNLDTLRLYDSVATYFKAYEQVTADQIYDLWEKLSLEANKLILNKRNEFALSTAANIMKCTNRNVALIKIGNNHLHRRTYSNIISKFSSKLHTIQDLCLERGYSYVYLLSQEDYKKLY